MTAVEITGDRLVVTMTGLDPFWSLRRRIVVPLTQVRGATADPGMAREHAGVRSPGTYVPRVITAGTYRKDGERTFWNLRASQQAVVIELTGHRFRRLVLGVADARTTAERVERALTRH
jgi:hypothetical protein